MQQDPNTWLHLQCVRELTPDIILVQEIHKIVSLIFGLDLLDHLAGQNLVH